MPLEHTVAIVAIRSCPSNTLPSDFSNAIVAFRPNCNSSTDTKIWEVITKGVEIQKYIKLNFSKSEMLNHYSQLITHNLFKNTCPNTRSSMFLQYLLHTKTLQSVEQAICYPITKLIHIPIFFTLY